MKGKRQLRRLLVVIPLSLVVIIMAQILLSKYILTVSDYSFATGEKSVVRCVLLTDLHNSEFGEENKRLITRIRSLDPDLILFAGDMVNGNEAETETVTSLIRSLVSIAPLYYSYGNHEKEYEDRYGNKLEVVMTEAGAHILDNNWEDIEINEIKLRLGGIYGYCLPPKFTHARKKDEQAFVTRYQDTDRYKILLCHMPVCWMINDGLDGWNVDLVLSGHNHGGQIIIPFIGGLYAPDMGWFPGRVWGEFSGTETDHKLIVSRGLGNESIIPRINNIPEIVSIEIGGGDE